MQCATMRAMVRGTPALLASVAAILTPATAYAQQPAFQRAVIHLRVVSDGRRIAGATAHAAAIVAQTDSAGAATLHVPAGPSTVTVIRLGFAPDTLALTLGPGADTTVTVDLQPLAASISPVVVMSTRTPRRVEDEPLRVEVLSGDDVTEKNEMRPGSLSSLLSEMSGVRMQVTSPSLGATNVRIQGLPGRYTLILNDGLPLYGTQASGFGLVQQPPLDLRQAEVIKGAASALYGPAALGGVVDLISRRPPDTLQVLVNGTARGGGDLLAFDERQLSPRVGLTVLGGLHGQRAVDADHDGWTDAPGLRRAEIRPRLFYDDSAGGSLMVTAGAFAEDRSGGAVPGSTIATRIGPPDSLTTRHADVGATGQLRLSKVVSLALRTSANVQDRRRLTGGIPEREQTGTLFGELSGTATLPQQVLVVGAAWQDERYTNRDVARFDESVSTPGLFVQHTYAPTPWNASTVNGRCDASSKYGTICTPRASMLIRPTHDISLRGSLGSGWFAPSALNDETEAMGLARVREPTPLEPERARTASLDATITHGPLQVNGTLFANRVRHPTGLRPVKGNLTGNLNDSTAASGVSGLVDLVNAPGELRTHGGELFAVYNEEPVVATAYYAATRSREISPITGLPREAPYVPRQEAGLDLALEDDESGAYAAVEVFYTGRQALDDDPYLSLSQPFTTVGPLAAKQIGRATVFLNLENLTNVRQARYEPIVRATPGDGGRWAVPIWGPLEGRALNGGVRYHF
ncbi:MAG: TonB-dependent receptor plug domain-containing protein [Gemmatimonadaceae bacterium]